MSKYTTSLMVYCRNQYLADGKDLSAAKSKDVILNALPHIFDFDYPIWDSTYKQHLEEMLVRHYFTDEIAYETFGLFKMELESYLNETMPKYNVMFNALESMGDIFKSGSQTVDHYVSDDLHSTDHTGTQHNVEVTDNTGTQTNVGSVTNTGTQTNVGSVANTGTQDISGETSHTGTQVTDNNSTQNQWTSERDVAEGSNYQDDAYVSRATKLDNTEGGDSTRTDDLKDTDTQVRTDNLKREDDFTRTDDLKRQDDFTRTDNLKREDDRTRTDDLNDTLTRRDDQTRTTDKTLITSDKIGTYGKLWEYYHNLEKEIIDGAYYLFMQIW